MARGPRWLVGTEKVDHRSTELKTEIFKVHEYHFPVGSGAHGTIKMCGLTRGM
jgi:hypothetical protein